MRKKSYSRSVEVFSGSPWETEVVRGLLESNGIHCVVRDGILGALAPYIAPSASILVTEEECEAALELIRGKNGEEEDASR